MIDLRSDTVTKPSPEMLEAMMKAEVGDDVYGEDPTINKLQETAAELFGKEAALFVPSGTMGNQICINILTKAGDEVILDSNAHIFYYETSGPSMLSNVQLMTLPSESGMIDEDLITSAIRPDVYYFPNTSVIALENTHNRHGGAIIDIDYIRSVRKIADEHGLKMHLDGARIWNASVATGISLKEYSESFDTISVCLSKGLGAPVGSLVLSSHSNIKKALKFRKILGGGLRQAGYLAAAGLFAIENNLPKLKQDHDNAKKFAQMISDIPELECNIDRVQTNIVMFKYSDKLDTKELASHLKAKGLLVSEFGNRSIRAVFHLDINTNQAESAAQILRETVAELLK